MGVAPLRMGAVSCFPLPIEAHDDENGDMMTVMSHVVCEDALPVTIKWCARRNDVVHDVACASHKESHKEGDCLGRRGA